jgi:hypothetical protein
VIVEDEYHYIVRYWKSGIIVTDNQFVPPRELDRAAELALVTYYYSLSLDRHETVLRSYVY